MQFDNPANVEVHKRTTAEEIARDFPEGLDYIFAGVGTGGHVSAVGEVLRPRWPKLQVFAVEPELSPVLSGGTPGPHPIQGIGAGFIPGNYHADAVTGVVQVAAPDAFSFASPGRARGRAARRRFVRGGPRGRGQEAARDQGRRPHPGLHLRHRRAVPLRAGPLRRRAGGGRGRLTRSSSNE